ncbi:MAG: hypothetical protein N2381_03170 [Armatimonadetes bacterium]|nr:hypothetical protein [Armatimonadota bacterium]
MSRTALWLAICHLAFLFGQAQTQMPSRLQPDVVLDYSYDAVHLLNGAGAPLYPADERYQRFLERLRQFPPEVLIVGKEAPFTHSLGPVLSFGGENVVFPPIPQRRSEDPRQLLSPDELKLRVKAIEQFVKDVHAAGVKVIVPYISPMTMFGEPEKQLGFFSFYDRWDEYAEAFDLGERPQGDPMEWTQRDHEGKLLFRFGQRKEFKPLTRYSMCINAKGWRQWQQTIVRWILKVGYDGVWMENALEHRCYCQNCQAFARSLGLDLSPKTYDLAQRAPQRVWLESYLRYFDELMKLGVKYLAVNYIEVPFQRQVTDNVDLCMIEHCWLGIVRVVWGEYKKLGRWTGFYSHLPDGTKDWVQTNSWLLRLAYAMRGKRGTHFLYGAPFTGYKPEFAHSELSSLLALAEGAAFGGGVAVHVVGSGAAISPFLNDNDLPAHRGRQKFFTFARKHRQLFEGLLPAGDVAIVVFQDPKEGMMESLLEAQQVFETLQWKGFLIDVLNGETVSESLLRRYRLVIVAGKPKMPNWMEALPLLRSPDPLQRSDWAPIAEAYQRRQPIPPLRPTKLSDLAMQKVDELRAIDLPEGSKVQAAAWANDRRIVLHMLNYRVPAGLERNIGHAEVVQTLTVRLKVPNGRKVKQARLYEVGSSRDLPFRQVGTDVHFVVPSLQVYAVAEVILQ